MQIQIVNRLILFLMSLPKTILFNLKYLPLKDGIKLPVFISPNVCLMEMKVNIKLSVISTGIVRIGYGYIAIFDSQNSRAIWQVTGTVEFN